MAKENEYIEEEEGHVAEAQRCILVLVLSGYCGVYYCSGQIAKFLHFIAFLSILVQRFIVVIGCSRFVVIS